MSVAPRMAGHALVECLEAQGVAHVFGVPGESYLAVLDGLHGRAIRFVNTRHESGAAFMAAASGKLAGRAGVAMVTRGPGATNAAIGVHTAAQDSSPMVLFVGQVDSRHRGREAFQEMDYRAVFGTIAKWVCEVDHPERMPELVMRAFATAESGRPGPVVVSLPENVLRAETTAPVPPRFEPAASEPAREAVERAVALVREAKRPLVIAGGGTWTVEGREALRRWCEREGLPVAAGFRSQDVIRNDSPAYAGDAGIGKPARMAALIDEADLVVALGARLSEILTDSYTRLVPEWFERTGARFVHAHPSVEELGAIARPDVALAGNVNRTVERLLEHPCGASDARARRMRAVHEEWRKTLDAPETALPLDMSAVMRTLRERLPEDAILTNGAGNFSIWSNRHYAFGAGARLLAPQSGSMGYGVPAAVAAKLAHPERTVVCLAGDGDFQMTGMELATGVAEGAAPVVLVVDNGLYGTIRMHQERDYPGRESGTRLANPDFAALARAMGAHGERVERTEDFADALDHALASDSGAVLHLVVPGLLSPTQTVALR